MQLPLSGANTAQSSVSTTQATANVGGGNSVNSISSSVNVQGQYSGSTPRGNNDGNSVALTLEKALALGLQFNLGAVSQSQAVAQAEGQRRVAKSTLMPNVNSVISEQVERLNLRTQGVESPMFPLTVQFNYFDARAARLTQAVFDLVRLQNLHSADASLKARIEDVHNSRDLIVLATAGTYLQLTATLARIAAATAEVETSRAIYRQAADRLAAGLNARIDATRSQVQLQTDQQRLRSLQADFDTQKLKLSRIIGLPPGQRFTVSDDYRYAALTKMTVDEALTAAFRDRSDLRAATLGMHAAEAAIKAARAERLPSVTLNADWGVAGLRPTNSAHSVYTVAGTLTIPLYEGGRIRGDIEQANAVERERRAEVEDLRGQVDQDVRQAFINLNSAADQVNVAKSNVDLSHDTLTQARDRFTAGIADTVELVQAQQSVVQAENDYISAVFEHNLAKTSLARAMGNAEQTLPQLLTK